MTNQSTRYFGAGTLLAMGLGFAMMASPPAQAGETFGTTLNSSVFLPALNFNPINGGCRLGSHNGVGYFKLETGCAAAVMYADLELPEGAMIAHYRPSFRDNATSDITVEIRTHSTIGGGGGTPSFSVVPGSSFASAGASTAYQNPFVAVNATYDTYDHTSFTHSDYFVRLSMPANAEDVLFRGVWLFWHRQVAPAPASATFNDVPTSHPFFNQVEQLTKSGITAGCGGGNYCPNAAVTRGQMAVFLSKALGLHWDFGTNAAP